LNDPSVEPPHATPALRPTPLVGQVVAEDTSFYANAQQLMTRGCLERVPALGDLKLGLLACKKNGTPFLEHRWPLGAHPASVIQGVLLAAKLGEVPVVPLEDAKVCTAAALGVARCQRRGANALRVCRAGVPRLRAGMRGPGGAQGGPAERASELPASRRLGLTLPCLAPPRSYPTVPCTRSLRVQCPRCSLHTYTLSAR